MLTDALVLSVLSTIGFVLAYQKLPRKVRRFLQKHALLTDIITFMITYVTMGSSLTALTAGAMVAIFTSVLIHVAANPDDFIYLYDMVEFIKAKAAECQTALKEYGATYKTKKEILEAELPVH